MSGEYKSESPTSEVARDEEEEYWDGFGSDMDDIIMQLEDTQLDDEDEAQDRMSASITSQEYDQRESQDFAPTTYTIPPDLHEIVYSPPHQKAFDDNGVSWPVQWEIARYLTSYPRFTWDDVPIDVLPQLCGHCADSAPTLADVLLKDKPRFIEYYRRERLIRQSVFTSPWEELDREETFIRDHNRGTSLEDFGGKVQHRLRLGISKSGGSLNFKFKLEQPVISKSCRFSRFLGSRRLLECCVSKDDLRHHKQAITDFFVKKKLLINGRLFQAFLAKPGKLGDNNRMSLPAFIAWHNSLHLNSNQTVNKWASRFTLGFSISQPGLVFRPENIHFIKDIYAEGKDKSTAASHEIMTDGCGYMNYAALKLVQENMAWGRLPTCIQARIAGSKGLFMLHPDYRDPGEDPKIWLSSSQVKIQLNQKKEEWSPIHYILDVVSGPFVPESSAITYEMIMNLSENGVSEELLKKMLRDTIAQEAQSLEPSSKPHGSQILYDSIYTSQRVLQTRLRQVIPPEAHRAHAILGHDSDDEDGDEDDGAVPAKWDTEPDPFSGRPASAQEQVLGWLQAGFLPTDTFVMEKLVYLQGKMMMALVKKFRILISESTRAFIVPDPLGILDKDEIFFASSQPVQTGRSGLTQCITGPVLVSRNPCIQASDTRKVVAVESYELWSRGYFDVIVFSTKGNRSLASLLSGGDYDGDTVVMIWDEAITSGFRNADEKFADTGADFEQRNFHKSKVLLRDLKAQAELNKKDITPDLIEALLQNIVQNQSGTYNIFYRCSAYLHGLKHPTTVRLGHMFTQWLDGTKSGLVVRDDVLKADKRIWNYKQPDCFPSKYDDDGCRGLQPSLEAYKNGEKFILEILQDVANEETKNYQIKLGQMSDKCKALYRVDQDLVRPVIEAEERVQHPQFQEFQYQLQSIKNHVKFFRECFAKACGGKGEYSAGARRGKQVKGGDSIGKIQESIRAVSEDYSRKMPRGLTMFSDSEVRRIAASYAYQGDSRFQGKFTFCFAVAWAELCAIKAQASGGAFVTLMPGYIDSMAIHRKMVKVFREMEGEEAHEV